MASGSISRQLCSVWQKIGISKKGDKELSCNIFWKSASTGIGEANDTRRMELADLMAHHPKTADKHYYIRQKQLSVAAGSTAFREKTTASSMSPFSPKKAWSNDETSMIEELFKDDIETKEISLEMIREKSNCFPYATPKQVYDKVRTIIGGKRSQIPVSADISSFNFSYSFFFLFKQSLFKILIFSEVIVSNISITLSTEEMVIRVNQNGKM